MIPALIIDDRGLSTAYYLEYEQNLLRWCSSSFPDPCIAPALMFLWQPRNVAIVLGLGQNVRKEVYLVEATKRQVPIFRRKSGGGCVIHGPGNICYTMIVPRYDPVLADIKASFARLLEVPVAALRVLGIEAQIISVSDIAVLNFDGRNSVWRKIGGTAQQRKKNYILQHGTLLHSLDLGVVSAFLREPEKRPAYRKERTHVEFMANMTEWGIRQSDILFQLSCSFAQRISGSHDFGDCPDTTGLPDALWIHCPDRSVRECILRADPYAETNGPVDRKGTVAKAVEAKWLVSIDDPKSMAPDG